MMEEERLTNALARRQFSRNESRKVGIGKQENGRPTC